MLGCTHVLCISSSCSTYFKFCFLILITAKEHEGQQQEIEQPRSVLTLHYDELARRALLRRPNTAKPAFANRFKVMISMKKRGINKKKEETEQENLLVERIGSVDQGVKVVAGLKVSVLAHVERPGRALGAATQRLFPLEHFLLAATRERKGARAPLCNRDK